MVFPSPEQALETPLSDVTAFLIEQHYRSIGVGEWDSRKVLLLCAKFGDTAAIMAARLRIPTGQFNQRMKSNGWTKQDTLILTLLEQAVDFTKGGVEPKPLSP